METTFEALAGALESTRGTAIATPTHLFPLVGMIEPAPEWYEPEEARGTLFRRYRQQKVWDQSNWSAEGGADTRHLPFLLNMAIGAGVITTPTNGVLTRLHTHKPSGPTDVIKTATLSWGDPNVQIWQSKHAVLNELTISADASGTDGTTLSVSGFAEPPVEVADPTYPAIVVGSLLIPGRMQIYIDTASAIGTTVLAAGTLVSAEFTLNNNIEPKHAATGPTGSVTYARFSRGRPDASTTFQLEVFDTTQMDLALAATHVKVRIRVNGDLIESVTPDYYEYVSWDMYGKLKFDGWGTTAGSNRTANFRIDTIVDSTLGADFQVQVQNQSATV